MEPVMRHGGCAVNNGIVVIMFPTGKSGLICAIMVQRIATPQVWHSTWDRFARSWCRGERHRSGTAHGTDLHDHGAERSDTGRSAHGPVRSNK